MVSRSLLGKMLFSVLFAALFCSVPWEQVRGIPFEDLDVYVEKFKFEDSLLDNVDHELGVAWYFTKEILWDVLIRSGSEIFSVSVETVLLFVSFVSVFGFSFVVLVRCGALGVLLLINPLVVDFVMSQLRMALAMSLLLLALFVRKKILSVILVFATFLIHTAGFIFVFFYFFIKYVPVLLRRLGFSISERFLALSVGVLTCIAIGPLREMLLGYFGDRRAEYDVQSTSLAYAAFWFIFLFFMLFQRDKYFVFGNACCASVPRGRQSHPFLMNELPVSRRFFSKPTEWPINLISVTCLTVFCLGTLMGVPVIRFISSVFPFLVVSFLEIKSKFIIFAYIFGFAFVLLQWIYWIV